LGLAVQRLLPRLLGDFLPVDVRLAPSWAALASGLAVGVVVAVLFSLLPLLGVRDVSPLVLLRRSVEPPTRRRRDPLRVLTALALALCFGAFLLDTLFVIQHNLLRDLRPGGSAARPNLVLFDIQPDQREPVEAAARAAGFALTPPVPIVPMRVLSVKGTAAT